MESVLILADEIIELLRNSGSCKMEAECALAVVKTALPSIIDINETARNSVLTPRT